MSSQFKLNLSLDPNKQKIKMTRRNIVIAPCGNKSTLFNDCWLKDDIDRDFDICLLFYHEHIDQPDLYKKVDFFFHLVNFKYKMLYELLLNIKPGWLKKYDYFYFLDDDIAIDTRGINKMFTLAKAFGASISQASLSADSFCSWPIFKQDKRSFLRFVGQIEVMAPLFEASALKICIPTFVENHSSWGIDAVWSKLLGYPEDKLMVFDTVVMTHTLPVGGGELYTKLNIAPEVEWREVTKKYQAKIHNYREYGRLKKLHIRRNPFYFLWNYLDEKKSMVLRKVRDYDICSRFKRRWYIFFVKKGNSNW